MGRLDPRMMKPFEYVRRPSMKGFNTSTIRVRGEAPKRGDGAFKSSVNCRRYNAEVMRQKLSAAKTVSIPILWTGEKYKYPLRKAS
jgi:hypothetical protein